MIEIEIDGKKIEVAQGTMVIEAADANDIRIPRFCYHKKLSIAANCRMCLVQVEKVGKPLPACATPVTPGMKVFTQSAMALDAQRSVMEFLLINHPLDCPICDQGGQCELQDISMGYGKDISRYTEGKRVVKDKNIGPLIATDMTRCIQCTRCVRFGQEVAGLREMGATGRGENMEIGTFVEHSLVSEISGNIIDLCPVGALTSKPFRFQARAWELQQAASIAPHDPVGSNIFIHTRAQEVMRVVPRENEALNETWLSDRDRYSYTGINSADRLLHPMIKQDGVWQETDWQTALTTAITGFKKLLNERGSDSIGALASPSATLEELYLLQKLWRDLGSRHLDHRLRQTDVSDQHYLDLYPGIQELAAIENSAAILIIGSNTQREAPLINLRIRKATLQGAEVCVINSLDYPLNFNVAAKAITAPQQLVNTLAAVVKILLGDQTVAPALQSLFAQVQTDAASQAIAAKLQAAEGKITILLGAIAAQHPQAALLRILADMLKQLVNAEIGFISEGANSAGAWLAGVVPHRLPGGATSPHAGLHTAAMFKEQLAGYFLWGIEPELDCANPQQAMTAMQQAEWVVCASAFKTPAMLDYANVLLPIAVFAETSGTYVNIAGQWQSFAGAVAPAGEARPGWKVLRVLGNLAELPAFDYISSEQVRDELRMIIENTDAAAFARNIAAQKLTDTAMQEIVAESVTVKSDTQKLARITEWPIYRVDALVRRAEPLQQSATAEAVAAYVNPLTAKHLQLQQDQAVTVLQNNDHAVLQLKLDGRVPESCVFIPAGFNETAMLNESFGEVQINTSVMTKNM